MKIKQLLCESDQIRMVEGFIMEMANINPDDSGLDYVIWVGPVGGKHGPRVKVSNIKGKMTNDAFVMSVSKTPEVLTPHTCKLKNSEIDDIRDWIKLNYDVLYNFWKFGESGEGSFVKLYMALRKL